MGQGVGGQGFGGTAHLLDGVPLLVANLAAQFLAQLVVLALSVRGKEFGIIPALLLLHGPALQDH